MPAPQLRLCALASLAVSSSSFAPSTPHLPPRHHLRAAAVESPSTAPAATSPAAPAALAPEEWFALAREGAPALAPALAAVRAEGAAALEALSAPTRKHEAWRFTDLSRPYGVAPGPAAAAAAGPAESWLDEYRVEACKGRTVVLRNGVVDHALSDLSGLPEGVSVASAAASDGPVALRAVPCLDGGSTDANAHRLSQGARPWAALNAACLGDAVVVDVAGGTVVDPAAPIHVLHVVSGAGVAHPRLAVRVGDFANSTILQTHCGGGGAGALCNSVTEVIVGEGSHVDHVTVQELETPEAGAAAGTSSSAVEAVVADVGKDSVFSVRAIQIGGALSRLHVGVTLAGEGSNAHVDGLMAAGGVQEMDCYTNVHHPSANTAIYQTQRNVIADKARVVFKGRIRVEQSAPGTDAQQSCRSLLLDDGATITAMPTLEIIADEVTCSHGATVSDLPDEEVFYLQSRGINRNAARGLLITSFAATGAAKTLPCPKLRARLTRKLAGLVPTGDRTVKYRGSSI